MFGMLVPFPHTNLHPWALWVSYPVSTEQGRGLDRSATGRTVDWDNQVPDILAQEEGHPDQFGL